MIKVIDGLAGEKTMDQLAREVLTSNSAPEARLNDDGTLDEIVATNATFHMERMSDGEWWMMIEAGSQRVDVTLYTRCGAKILANLVEADATKLHGPRKS